MTSTVTSTLDYRTVTDDRTADGRVVRLLALLEGDYRPTYKKMGPLRHLKGIPVPDVTIPRWGDWKLPAANDLTGGVRLDANAAYLSAASSVRVGLNTLVRHQQAPDGKPILPGWYLIDWHHWQHRAIVSPLGPARRAGQLWVAHPTLQLLRKLEERNVWPDTTVYDCWTSDVGVRLTRWTDLLRDTRAAIKAAGDDEAYDAFKLGYAEAIQMILTGKKCDMTRPDWTHAVWAQHSAFTIWWKAWRALDERGCGPVRMMYPDEMTFTAQAYAKLVDLQELPNKERPLTLDLTGRDLGAFHIIDPAQEAA